MQSQSLSEVFKYDERKRDAIFREIPVPNEKLKAK
jgi:hypothetical protein